MEPEPIPVEAEVVHPHANRGPGRPDLRASTRTLQRIARRAALTAAAAGAALWWFGFEGRRPLALALLLAPGVWLWHVGSVARTLGELPQRAQTAGGVVELAGAAKEVVSPLFWLFTVVSVLAIPVLAAAAMVAALLDLVT